MSMPKSRRWPAGFLFAALLAALLALLFARSFLPDYVLFANDGPLGQQHAQWLKLPSGIFGLWNDLNDAGFNDGAVSPSVSSIINWLLGPLGCAKFYAPIALFVLGLGAWTFFRMLKLTALAAALGAIATVLSTTFFGGVCWGVGSVEIGIGFDFFALALVVANAQVANGLIPWVRYALAGLCVGVNVMEAADVGALCSLFVAGFVVVASLIHDSGSLGHRAARSLLRVLVVAAFAGFIAMQTVRVLIGFAVTGVAGTAQDAQTKAERWDYATQWSLPKQETLGIFVPGLFGYRMDTPQNMLPALQDAYQGGVYWGGMGRSPEIDRFFDSGKPGTPPPGMMRFSGGGDYCGILVGLVAFWAIAQSLRRQNSPYSAVEKKFIWFWTAVLVASLLLSWGRFAPMFYGLLYQLPYFSTIRNPVKFLIFFELALVVLFAYGIHALTRPHLKLKPAAKGKAPAPKWDAFDRKWTYASLAVWGACLLGWLIYAGNQPALIQYLQKVGYGDPDFARQIAAFSVDQAGWFVGLLATAIALVTLTLRGFFTGSRAGLGAILLGGFLVFDLGRANLPFIIHWDYIQKYDIDPANSADSTNPIINLLREKPYEHRVAYGLPAPLQTPPDFQTFEQLYRIEWMQHHFPYYNIQCLDLIQMSRMAEDLQQYLGAFQIRAKLDSAGNPVADPETFWLPARRWQLTNTRYLLGPAGLADFFNNQMAPARYHFKAIQRFEIVPKPGVSQPQQLSQLTAVTNDNGRYALIEFTDALPRAKLYGNWEVNTNDPAVLKQLADLNFNPAQTLLVDSAANNLPRLATNENSGTVEYKHYEPKDIILMTSATQSSVLLLNDKFDPHWHVTVDGQPADLLRCNFLMRGVQVPPGSHRVEFHFSLSNKPLYVTLISLALGMLLTIGLVVLTLKNRGIAASDLPNLKTLARR